MPKIPSKIVLTDGLRVIDRVKRIDIHIKDGDSLTLNDTASDFFREVQKSSSFDEIMDALLKLYRIEMENILDDALELIEMLQQYGVIRCEYDS